MKKKKFIVLLLLICLCLTGCSKYKGHIHSEDEFIDYVDNLTCDFYSSMSWSCDLEGRYEIVGSEITYEDYKGESKEVLTYTFQINNTDVTFEVKSYLKCTSSIDGSCFQYTYSLSDNFVNSVKKYYLNSFFEDNEYMQSIYKTNSNYNGFYIYDETDLNYVIEYIDGFLDFINTYDLRVLDKSTIFYIMFMEDEVVYDELDIYFNLELIKSETYSYKFKNEYCPKDGTLSTYIENYMIANNIEL